MASLFGTNCVAATFVASSRFMAKSMMRCLALDFGLKPMSLALYESLGFEVTSNTNVDLWEGPRPLMIMEKTL